MAEYILRCDLAKQYRQYSRQINKAIIKVLKRGVYTIGKEVTSFEKEFAAYIGRMHGVAVASGTDALMLALKAAGIKQGDGIITAAYAPAPVPTAIVLAGGVPIFVDIEEKTCLIDPKAVEKKISKNTKYIIPVHLFGLVCDMSAICGIAKKNSLTVIEDAAQAHGSTYNNKRIGSFGLFSCFSFYPTKNLGGYGDGGMILTDDKRSMKLLRLLRNYGKKYNPFNSETLGYNSRLDELQAAILRIKLRYLDEMNNRRASLVEIYKKELKDTPITFLEEHDRTRSNYHILTVLCKKKRDDLVRFLAFHKIQTNVYYPRPLHLMNAFKKYINEKDRFPNSEKISKQALALPLYPELTKEKVLFVIDKIKQFFKR